MNFDLSKYIGWFLAEDSFPSMEGDCALCGKHDRFLLELGDPKGRESEEEPATYLVCYACAGAALANYQGVP